MEKVYKIKYRLTLADGTLVDESMDEALVFSVGDGTLHKCLEDCVIEVEDGGKQKYIIMAEKGFGEHSDFAIQEMNKSDFSDKMELQVDDVVEFETPIGDKYVGAILEINDSTVKVDFNHQLAGHNVIFDVEVLE